MKTINHQTKHIFALLVGVLFLLSNASALTLASTYNAGDIPTNNTTYSAACNGPVTPLTVSLPAGGPWEVTAVDVVYDMTALGGGYRSEQRSQLYCQNSTTGEGTYYAGTGTGGVHSYNRTGLTIADGSYAGGTNLVFEMQAYRTWTGGGTCNATYNKIDNGTWTVTVTYSACNPMGSCTPLVPWGNTDHITNVNINTINNGSGCSAYTDYTATTTNVNAGSSYLLTVNVGGTMGFGVFTDCAGWVDWNNDGDFADANETISFFNNGTSGPMTALVTVPGGTGLGNKTMRLRSAQGGTTMTACNTTVNGEVEDYTLNVATSVAPSITVSITQGVAGSVCLGDMITLDAVPVSTPAITSYQWYYGNYTDAQVDSDIDASQSGVYSIIVQNASGEAAMTTYTLTVNDPPSGGVIGNYTYCGLNDSAAVQLSLSGNGPFSVIVNPGGLVYNNVSNGSLVNLLNDSATNFLYLSQITDANGCVINLGNPTNVVTNGDGTTLTGWTITANGGNGWLANGTFRTSYGWDRKFQVIDLVAAGYTTAELDTAPIVYASEQYSSIFNNQDEYSYIVTLQDASFNTIAQKTISLSNIGSNAWQVAAFTFMGYGPGLRYIRYEHGGVDTEWWAGHYGARIDNSTVTLNWKGNISTGFLQEDCPLPVSLVSFNGACDGSNVQLNWATASEINNDYFTIERSADATNFEPIAIVNGKGNISAISNYTWLDETPLDGVAYYRLKQTDFNGAYEYHEIISVACNKGNDISVYPNPFENSFTVQLSENLTYPIHIEVVDYLGRKVHAQTIETRATEITLNDQLPTGTYFIKVITEASQVVERIVKMK